MRFLSRGFKNLQWYGMTLFETLEPKFEGFSFPLLDPVFISLPVSGGDKKILKPYGFRILVETTELESVTFRV